MKSKVNGATIGGLVIGAVAGNFVAKQGATMVPMISKYSGALPLVIGYFLAGMKSDIAKAAGAGMIAAGGAQIVGSFLPATAAPVGEDLTEVLNEDLTQVLNEDLTEVLNEDLTEDMSEDFSYMNEDLTEELA
jgi:predicted RecB family endonuclease